jgi:hypothetical protein
MMSGAAFGDASASGQWLGLGVAAGRIEFDDLATDAVSILSANVGIGNAAPNAKLEVDGNIYIPVGMGNIGIGTSVPRAGLVVGSDTTLTYPSDSTSAYVQGNLEVDQNLYVRDNALVVTGPGRLLMSSVLSVVGM